MSSPSPKRPAVVTRTRSLPKRNNSGTPAITATTSRRATRRQQRGSDSSHGSGTGNNSGSTHSTGTASSVAFPGIRRTRTMPTNPTSPKRLSASKMTMPSTASRFSKLFDFCSLDDGSTSATSFLSMSLSNHSAHNSHGGSGSSRFRTTSTVRPTEICVEELEDFCSKVLLSPEHDCSKDLVTILQFAVKDYAKGRPAALQELELSLTSILESTPTLPSSVVAELHSYRGLVHLARADNNAPHGAGTGSSAAIESFTRALWIQSHMSKSSSSLVSASSEQASSSSSTLLIASNASHLWDVAVTEHRLGVAYGRSGKYLKAIDQMEHALQSYDKAGVGISETCYVEAKEDLHEFQEAHQISLLRSSGRHIRHSLLRRTRSCRSAGNTCTSTSHGSSTSSSKIVPDEVKVERERRELERQDSFAY